MKAANQTITRRFPIGAEIHGSRVDFRVWAPDARRLDVVFEGPEGQGPAGEPLALVADGEGCFRGAVEAAAGALYRLRIDERGDGCPDPASRFQPEGPHGPSQVVDATGFRWEDGDWAGVGRSGQVLYEMHVGTFTPEGTWTAAAGQLAELRDLGVTVIELMPIGDFPGRFGWGYDGVNLFAPTRLYGSPDEFRQFVQRAHQHGLGVILDVVYNHLGPDGDYLKQFSRHYYTDRYENDWGAAINFDGPMSGPVREYFITNAAYWIEEFHLDGFRFDATQQIFDASEPNILAAISEEARRRAGTRGILLVAENEPQHTRLVRPREAGGFGIDALWNDDFHHAAMVALTSRNEAYYTDYLARPQEFVSLVKWGFLFQGQRYKWQKARRGTPALDLPPEAFINFIQNHDQVANSGKGERCHEVTAPGPFRAITALFLLAPSTPMLLQGQEFGASAPFHYFADHTPELAASVAEGRRKFLAQFPSLAQPEIQRALPNPGDPRTFERCKLDFSDRERHAEIYRLHKDLLRLRRTDARFRQQIKGAIDGAVLSESALLLRYFSPDPCEERLVIINLGRDLHLDPAPEPLLAPPEGTRWDLVWSSEDSAYGGGGTPPVETEENWRIPGACALVLQPKFQEPPSATVK
jgi:maltooligosyltrehalose trehalohydrolase